MWWLGLGPSWWLGSGLIDAILGQNPTINLSTSLGFWLKNNGKTAFRPCLGEKTTPHKLGQNLTMKMAKIWPASNFTAHTHTHIYIYIYICAVELLSGPSLAFSGFIIWSKFVFLNTVCPQHYKNRGFSTFLNKKLRTNISGVIIWSKLALLKRTQLGPENNPYLDQIMTPQMYLFL